MPVLAIAVAPSYGFGTVQGRIGPRQASLTTPRTSRARSMVVPCSAKVGLGRSGQAARVLWRVTREETFKGIYGPTDEVHMLDASCRRTYAGGQVPSLAEPGLAPPTPWWQKLRLLEDFVALRRACRGVVEAPWQPL
jgi:hypothetical protein